MEDGLKKRLQIERIENPNPSHRLGEDLEEVRQRVARVQEVDSALQDDFLHSLDKVKGHIGELEAKDTSRSPNGESVVILAALMFLAAEHGGRKTIIRAKDAFAKYFPNVDRSVWLGVQKAAHEQPSES